MEESTNDVGALREMVKSAVEQCTDALLLDLVYKMFLYSE